MPRRSRATYGNSAVLAIELTQEKMTMSMVRQSIAVLISVAGVLGTVRLSAETTSLSLKHGVYVIAAERCHGAPNATILFWDGIGFSGAHSSRCTSKIQPQHGARFKVDTTCAGLGDGSDSSPESPVDSFILKRLSAARFEIVQGSETRTYRWCGAGPPT